ncbi:MAG: type II asparaginase [Kiritimatiellaeota bacterium]|nr:type II asparaginase [Kiritimatiellota bacterium]
MKRQMVLVLAAIAAVMLALASVASAKPKIVVLATGGTIAGAQASTKEVGYKSGTFKVEDLIKAVPQISELADLTGEQIVNIGSQNMNNEVWLKLAKRVNAVLKQEDIAGVVITHGTDTMEETAYFLSLVVKSDKPVVMVGSMRPATATSADGPANLYNAVAVAIHPDARGRGVLVVLNDEIHYAREIEKQNSTQLDTFKSPNRGRAGVANTGAVHFFNKPATLHTTASEFSVDGVDVLPRVEIIYSYANLGRDFIDCAVEKGAKGLVLAGVGDGNSTDPALAALGDAVKKGVVVVRSSRTGSGLVVRNVEIDDDKMGTVAAMELNPQKARVLLMLALMKTSNPKEIQDKFLKY